MTTCRTTMRLHSTAICKTRTVSYGADSVLTSHLQLRLLPNISLSPKRWQCEMIPSWTVNTTVKRSSIRGDDPQRRTGTNAAVWANAALLRLRQSHFITSLHHWPPPDPPCSWPIQSQSPPATAGDTDGKQHVLRIEHLIKTSEGLQARSCRWNLHLPRANHWLLSSSWPGS